MKKLLGLLLLMVLLVGCESTPQVPTYSQDEVDTLLQELQDSVYTKSEVDVLLADLSYEDTFYTKEQVDTLLQAVNDLVNLQYTNAELDEGFNDIESVLQDIEGYIIALQDMDTAHNNQFYVVQDYIDEIEAILISIEVIEGLNGQTVYYIPNKVTRVALKSATTTLGAELDKSKAPSYVLDANGDYIPFNVVATKLCDKYFVDYTLYKAELGSRIYFNVDTSYSQEEFLVRSILLIEELSKYDFYIISGSYVQIQTNTYASTAWVNIPIATLRSSFVTLNADVMIQGLYEVQFNNFTFNNQTTLDLYNTYVNGGTFDGYVLDYK